MNNTTSAAFELSKNGIDVEQMIRAVVYVVTFILGSIGNLLVLLILKAKGPRRTVNDIFIMNLATADLTLIFFLPILIYKLFGTFPHSLFFCHIIQPFMTTTFFVSVFTLTSMAVHRCRAILHPFWPDVKKRTVYLWLAAIWLLSLALLVPLMVVNTVDDPPLGCRETWPLRQKRIYTAALMVLQFLLPMVITTCAYALICLDLFKPRTRFGSLYRGESSTTDSNNSSTHMHCSSRKRKEDIRIVKTLAIIVILFAVCSLPGQVAWMLLDFGNEYHRKLALDIFFKIYVIFAVFHSCWNPIVYGTLTRRFRRGYLRYMTKFFCWHTNRFSGANYSSRPPTSLRNSGSNSAANSPNFHRNDSDEIVERGEINLLKEGNLPNLNLLINDGMRDGEMRQRFYSA